MGYWLLPVVFFCLASPASAQQFKIRDVRLGFPSPKEDRYKIGYWAPVTVDVDTGTETFKGTLTVEATDGDGVGTKYTRENVAFTPQKSQEITYIKIGGRHGEVRVVVAGLLGRREVSETFTYNPDQRTTGLTSMDLLVLGLGQPQGLDPPPPPPGARGQDRLERYIAYQTDMNLLPDSWLGYEGVDVIVLPTGDITLLRAIEGRKLTALEDWVKLGGHLVVTVSSNHHFVARPQSFPLEPLLPARIHATQTDTIEQFSESTHGGLLAWIRSSVQGAPGVTQDRRGQIVLARLEPRHLNHTLATEEQRNTKLPVVVQGPYGLGRVSVVGFDTDQGFFRFWELRQAFWSALFHTRPRPAATSSSGFGLREDENDLAAQLAAQLEAFGEVPVISFGWVALFIFVYILIIGPLDYFFLKKVVKRLEWTWVTFPTVVLLVSLGAYLLAQYLKGSELRINKVDVVDIVVDGGRNSQQVYGSSWFTVFSPRFQHYDLNIDPSPAGGDAQGTYVSWMGRPGRSLRGLDRGQSPSLFRRSYDYVQTEQDGRVNVRLNDVPVQVWSVKTMTARWHTPLDASKPLVVHDLRRKEQGQSLEGSITSQLPWKLENALLLYRKAYWDLGTIEKGETTVVPNQVPTSLGSTAGMPYAPAHRDITQGLLRNMMFHERGDARTRNDYTQYLDQSWRFDLPEEAILVGYADAEGCRLVLEPSLNPTKRQTTLVRVFLPVQPPKK